MLVFANFVTKCTIPEGETKGDDSILEDLESPWMMYVDGVSSANGSGIGLILINLEGRIFNMPSDLGFSLPTMKLSMRP